MSFVIERRRAATAASCTRLDFLRPSLPCRLPSNSSDDVSPVVSAVARALSSRSLSMANESQPRSSGSSCFSREISTRSEEHTSELQSHLNLVCRLLLEKKKDKCLTT